MSIFYGEKIYQRTVADILVKYIRPGYITNANEEVSSSVIMKMVSRGFKAFGGRIMCLVCSGGVAKSILKASQVKNVAGAGYGFLLSHSASFFNVDPNEKDEILRDGIIYVCEAGMEEVLS